VKSPFAVFAVVVAAALLSMAVYGLRGRDRDADADRKGSQFLNERRYTRSFRSFTLPTPVEEDKVQLPRLYMVWLSPPYLTPGDAELDILGSVLTGGKNSRLYKRLVYDLQIAQDVSASQSSSKVSSSFSIESTAREGHTLKELEKVIQEEIDRLKREAPTTREVQRAVNQFEAGFLDRLETVGGFGGKANQLNSYFFFSGNPDYFQEDLSRYQALEPNDIRAVAQTYLRDDGRVVLSIVPLGKRELAATAEAEAQ